MMQPHAPFGETFQTKTTASSTVQGRPGWKALVWAGIPAEPGEQARLDLSLRAWHSFTGSWGISSTNRYEEPPCLLDALAVNTGVEWGQGRGGVGSSCNRHN